MLRGPIDFLVIEYPPGADRDCHCERALRPRRKRHGAALRPRGGRKRSRRFVCRDRPLRHFAGRLHDVRALAGARSGLVATDDLEELAGVIDPGAVAIVVMYENRWAVPFVACGPLRGSRRRRRCPPHGPGDHGRPRRGRGRELRGEHHARIAPWTQDARRLTVSPHRVVVHRRPLLGDQGGEAVMGVLFSLRRALIQVATDATPVTPDPERHTEPHAATKERPQVAVIGTQAARSERREEADHLHQIRPARRAMPGAQARSFAVSRRASSATAP